jgi:hypothetical protein
MLITATFSNDFTSITSKKNYTHAWKLQDGTTGGGASGFASSAALAEKGAKSFMSAIGRSDMSFEVVQTKTGGAA